MREVFLKASPQVAENLIGIALGNGFELPPQVKRKEWVEALQTHVQNDPNPHADQDPVVTNFFNSFLEVERIRNQFVKQLKRVLNPRIYGIERDWKQTQREALEAIIRDLETWITRPLIELPTGLGKSMVWGAIMRAFYDALRIFGLEKQTELVLMTSRINIADQMLAHKLGTDNVDDEYTDDEPLNYGDIKMWFTDLSDKHIRVLAGKSGSAPEIRKDAFITLICYQGLKAQNFKDIFRKKVVLGICDESHRVSDRTRVILENSMYTAFFVGGSATTKGHKGNNPFKFFEARKPEVEDGIKVPYAQRLTYCASIIMCVQRGELKKIRYINARTSIDLSSVKSSTRDSIPQKEAGKLIAKNIPLMEQILEELFLGDYPVFDITGSKKPVERKWIVFVDRVAIAEQLSEFCNAVLLPKVKKKYGEQSMFAADFVSGERKNSSLTVLTPKLFRERMTRFEHGLTTIMFSSDKLGEGADIPNTSGVLGFRAHGLDSLWKLLQEYGRGTRFMPGEDLLIVDGVFQSENHEIASALSVLGVDQYLAGGLVAGLQGERETEMRVFRLLTEGFSWLEIWNQLDEKERVLVPFVKTQISIPPISSDEEEPELQDVPNIYVNKIEFVENSAIKLGLILHDREKLVELVKVELAKHDITDYWSLTVGCSLKKFQKLEFGIFGKGRGLISCSLNRSREVVNSITIEELATKLGWTPTEEERLQKYRDELAKHGITNYWTLTWFGLAIKGLDFGIFGKGSSFVGYILGSTVTSFTNPVLEKIIEKFGWTLTEEQRLQYYLSLLAKHGITDYWSLVVGCGMSKFQDLQFEFIGGAQEFLKLVLGDYGNFLTSDSLNLLATKLGWTPTEEERLQKYRDELAKHGITDYWSLTGSYVYDFKALDFGIFGKGGSFISYVLGEAANANFNKNALHELATKLGWIPTAEERLKQYQLMLAKHEITDYWSLVYACGAGKFRELDFGGLGKATRFAIVVLKKDIKSVTVPILEELAAKLGWIPTEEQRLEYYRSVLAKHGIIDYQTLVNFGTTQFREIDFYPFGKGNAFLGKVLGLERQNVSLPTFVQVAHKLGWKI